MAAVSAQCEGDVAAGIGRVAEIAGGSENQVATRRNGGSRGKLIFRESRAAVAEEPAADVEELAGGVLQLVVSSEKVAYFLSRPEVDA